MRQPVAGQSSRITSSFIERSVRSLRGAAAVGSAGLAASISSLAGVAQELSKAERRRRRRQREREEEREERGRNRDDNDDDEDDDTSGSPLRQLRARQESAFDAAAQRRGQVSAGDDGNSSSLGQAIRDRVHERIHGGNSPGADNSIVVRAGGRSRDSGLDEDDGGLIEVRQAAPSITTTDNPNALVVGSGDSVAMVDPDTGAAIAESNGTTAIAGPDGAVVATSGGRVAAPATGAPSPPPTTRPERSPSAERPDADTAGGENDVEFAS